MNVKNLDMKRIKYVLILSLTIYTILSPDIHGQISKQYSNTVSFIVSPIEQNGIGLGYSYKCIYISGSRGTYKLPDSGYLEDNYKFSAGYVKKVDIDRFKKICNLYSIGLVYHLYGEAHYKTLELSPSELFPISFEVGAGAGIGRFSGVFRFDPLKWEASIVCGISF